MWKAKNGSVWSQEVTKTEGAGGVVGWIPAHPDLYLHACHAAGPRPGLWYEDYRAGRHIYAASFKHVANRAFRGVNGTTLCKKIGPFIEVAARMVPEGLTELISPVQTDDWSSLPDDQIRRVFARTNVLFSKIVLAKIALQLAIFAKDGELETAPKGKVSDPKKLIEELAHFEPSEVVVFETPDVHPATYRFAKHDGEIWRKALVGELLSDFKSFTRQTSDDFVASFIDGGLCTLQTLRSINRWIEEEQPPGLTPGWIEYFNRGERVKAARKELVLAEEKKHESTNENRQT